MDLTKSDLASPVWRDRPLQNEKMNQPIVNRLYTSINKDSTLTEVMDAQYSAAAVGADCLIDFCMNSWVVPVQIRDDLRNLDILSREDRKSVV